MEIIHGYLIIDFSYLDPPVKQTDQIEQVYQSLLVLVLVLLSAIGHCNPHHHLTWNHLGPQVVLNNSLTKNEASVKYD